MSLFSFITSKTGRSGRDEVILKKLSEHRTEFITNDNGTLSIDLANRELAKRLAVKIEQLRNVEVAESN